MTQNKFIEIHGIGFPNKGAELLLHAALDQLKRFGTNITPLVLPSARDPKSSSMILHFGGRMKAGPAFGRIDLAWLGNRLTPRLAQMYGLGRECDSMGLLDASGLAYSDQWGPISTRRGSRLHRRYKKRGLNNILLPQAFGPFELCRSKRHAKRLFLSASLVFARDRQSYNTVRELAPTANVHMCPDITFAFKVGRLIDVGVSGYCLIPNQRIVDKGNVARHKYIRFLADAANYIASCGDPVYWLNHEGPGDRRLIDEAAALTERKHKIYDNLTALEIKSVLTQMKGVLSSRYHGVVSSLSGGVPVVATGWNHKYRELLNDFDMADCLVEPGVMNGRQAGEMLRRLGENLAAKEGINQIAFELEERVNRMWKSVGLCLGLPAC